ncbi:MAG: hypothetical protein ABIW81_03125 [Terrimesophilobacter sp.]
MSAITEDPERFAWGKDEPMNAEAIENYLHIADDDDFVVVPEPLWGTHPIMANLRETPDGCHDSAYYFTGISAAQKRDWASIRFWSQDPDNNRFERMLLAGEDREILTSSDGPKITVHAELWWAGRIWDERWLAQVPRHLEVAATAHVITDLAAGTLSSEDRDSYVKQMSKGSDFRDLQRARWMWPDSKIIMAKYMGF